MDLNLKGALIAKYGSQTSASRDLGIRESRLSRLIRGHEKPRPEEIQIVREKLGVELGEERAE
jgi:hypothetical protein